MTKEEKEKLKFHFAVAFQGESGRKVLEHLADFTQADNADFCSDERLDAYRQGRRSVMLEIRSLLQKEN